jgi:hypothetical protein
VDRHWAQIADIFGEEFQIETSSSLSVMIDMKLNDKVLILSMFVTVILFPLSLFPRRAMADFSLGAVSILVECVVK